MNAPAQFSMDDLLDGSIDDLADLPEFKPYPAGAHRVVFNYETKVVNDAPAVEFQFSALETLELNDPQADQPLEAGAESNVLFQLNNEFAQGKFKLLTKVLSEHHGVATAREALEASKGMELTIITKQRESKKDKGTFYTDVVNFIV